MEKSLVSQSQTMPDNEFTRFQAYLIMRNVSMPMALTQTKTGIKIIFRFSNTNVEFNSTDISTMYKHSIQITEEMYDIYNTEPLREYL